MNTQDPAGRQYVELSEVAAACGLDAYALDRHHRPDDWAMPRDCQWRQGRMWYAVDSLPELVEALQRNGQAEAARRLNGWANPWVPKVVATFAAGTARFASSTAGAPPGATPPAVASTPSTVPAARGDPPHKPVSGADARARWETEHNA